MKTTFTALVTLLVTAAALSAQGSRELFSAAQKSKPARVTSIERIAPVGEPGTPIVVRGSVLDASGKSAAGVEVFAYHTDRTGIYAPDGAADPWRLKGWAVTDADGRFEFRTIRPGPYPNARIPAHVHVILTTTCCGRQEREMVFDDDPLIDKTFRDGHGPDSIFIYGRPQPGTGGTQEVTYTIRLKPRGNF